MSGSWDAFAEALDEVAEAEAREIEDLFVAAARVRDLGVRAELAGPPEHGPRGVWADGTPVSNADRNAAWETLRRVSAARYPRPSGVYAALELRPPGDMPPMLRWALGYGG